ncbi:double-strand break repair protein MRE11 [Cimex lectularius]|uniref:Double-strand break repair protein n=1 Tax=Cimex lectularius TaxID=79782 RepID=A0A8I6R9W1_CIMLE|nr:double-strand break repair protein MRE11 [Cimex lectularius]XP_014240470.1 double-strand break repair protein MRE11 [Cimex lectularius]
MPKQDENLFVITLATDLHLGCHEKDGIRFDDSFIAFEEILDISVKKDVDFILLAGDMFHDNKPSPICIKRSLELLRQYCMGDKPISVEFLSDEHENFKNCPVPRVNYQDPNYNISIPVYSIHGNHDDPCGFGRTSALDILSASGLVNYIGKWMDLTKIILKPILLRKGKTQIAIYGLSHIRDERLNRLLKTNLVEFERPPNKESWFNILLLHQNRVNRQMSSTNVIHESMIPDFFDLVIWGHEHECRIEPEWNDTQQFYVTQPGSPVATSLCAAEAVEKKIGFLTIKEKEFKIEPVKLQTVRPFVFDTASVDDWKTDDVKWDAKKLQSYAEKYIKSKLLLQAHEQVTGHPKQPILPLIRLRIEYENENQVFNQIRCSQLFSDYVANPADVVILKKVQPITRASRKTNKELTAIVPDSEQNNLTVQSLIEHFFFGNENDQDDKTENVKHLEVLSVKGMAEAVKRFVEKDDKEAIQDLAKYQMNKVIKHLKESSTAPAKDQINEALKEYQSVHNAKPIDELEEIRKLLESDRTAISSTLGSTTMGSSMDHDMSSDDDFGPPSVQKEVPAARGRGRGRGRAPSKSTRGTRGSKANANTTSNRTISDFLSKSLVKSSSFGSRQDSDEEENAFARQSPRKKARLNYSDE